MQYRLALLLAALPGLVAAQRQRPAARGAASITIADVQRRIGVIADDSMLGRATPSPQLDAVAAYVAGEFQRFGLRPGGDSGTYFQHYPLEVLRFDPESSTIRITGRTPGVWHAGQDVLLVEGQPPAGTAAGTALVSPDSLRAWGDRPLVAHPLADITLQLDVRGRVLQHASAPNAIGILEGSDAALKKEYVLFSAHMDHIGTPSAGEGCTPRGADSICNGADDDGSGTVAVIELAEAFASARERPKRSLVFMTVSGEERGLWGSAYFADHPTVPLADVIADLNIDMVGRNSKGTVAVIGREHSNLGATLDSVAAAHRELNIKPAGDLWPQEGLFFRSDHYNFAKKGVPILFFTTGLHPDYHQVTDSPEKINAEKETRFARLVFYLGQAVANTSQRPRWNPDSYKLIVGGSCRLAVGVVQLGARLRAPQLCQQHF